MINQTATGRRSVVALAALMLAGFAFFTVEMLPVGLLSVIADDIGVSESTAGLLVTGYGVTVAIVSLPLTHLVRRIPRRHLIAGLLAVFVAATCVSVTGGYWTLLGGRVVTALAQAVFWAVAPPAAAALFSPQVRGRVTAALIGGGSLASVLGVPTATWLGQQTSWRTAFLAVAGLGLLSLAGVALLMPTSSPDGGHAATGSAPDARRYWTIVAATAVAITGVFAAYTYISPFLTEVSGFGPESVSLLLLVYGLAGLGGVAAGGALADRAPRAAMLAPLAILTATLLALYLFGTGQAATVACVAVWGFAMPQIPATFQSRVLQVAPGSTDMASAVFSAMFNVGIASGALIGSILLAHTGVRSTFLTAALLTAVALLILLSEPRRRPG
ncbi:DHA1 family inner membrane transport protein [Actinoplanes tereljensis]|uniref:MFS transporter n=1 Tax=Paractinoplanes tereljensis TaxID=571912 RepID=A0A919NNI3_9ACTN|nr:MFS transporter [Actinoplanes tereljensis]GIF21032.1 MFS transporter [Actinoplanes tereljensis]